MNLFFDLETIPGWTLDDVQVTPPANYKKAEAMEKYIRENREAEFRKGALHGISAQIISIAFAIDDDPVVSCCGPNEKKLLETFCAVANGHDTHGARPNYIGHNISGFDLRMLYQRLCINGLSHKLRIPVDARHGSGIFDTMLAWAGSYPRGYIKQDVLYKALGGPEYPDDDMDGSKVYDAWLAGEFEKISAYNRRDVEKCRYIYRMLT